MLGIRHGDKVLDVACGQGQFAGVAARAGAEVTGIDAAPALITLAKQHTPKAKFFVGDAKRISAVARGPFTKASIILALQNIDEIEPVFAELAKVMAPGGRVTFVLTHPCFRIQRQSGWGWDEARKSQYRRVDSYLSEQKIPIVAHPGKERSAVTWTFHRPLQTYVAAFARAGFALDGLEEWTSNKVSTMGSHAKAENRIRQEIPLFLAVRVVKM